jgi:hypothetical protein
MAWRESPSRQMSQKNRARGIPSESDGEAVGIIPAIARAHGEDDTDKIIRHPVGMAYRIALRMLGQRLADLLADAEQMMDLAHRAAEGPGKLKRMVLILNAWKPVFEGMEDAA